MKYPALSAILFMLCANMGHAEDGGGTGAEVQGCEEGSGSEQTRAHEQGTGVDQPAPMAHEEGSGQPQLAITSDQRLVVQWQESADQLVGSQSISGNYINLPLDAIAASTGLLVPDAGRAEVLLHCGTADVLVYRREGDTWVEVAAASVATDICVE